MLHTEQDVPQGNELLLITCAPQTVQANCYRSQLIPSIKLVAISGCVHCTVSVKMSLSELYSYTTSSSVFSHHTGIRPDGGGVRPNPTNPPGSATGFTGFGRTPPPAGRSRCENAETGITKVQYE